MCEDMAAIAGTAAEAVASPAPVEARVEALQVAVDELRRQLVDLRMGQRKALLEELAALENPLVEQGVIGERTRRPRHK